MQPNMDRIPGQWDDPKINKWEISPFVDMDHQPNESMIMNESKFYNMLSSDLCNICVADPLLTQFRDFSSSRFEPNQTTQVKVFYIIISCIRNIHIKYEIYISKYVFHKIQKKTLQSFNYTEKLHQGIKCKT